MGRSPAQLRAYVDGPDNVTGRPFMTEVFDALTNPPGADDNTAQLFDRSTPRFVEPDSEENLHQLFQEQRWTDMLPIVLPTEERVAAMLAGTSRGPDEVVGHMRPTGTREAWEYTVGKSSGQRSHGRGKTGLLPCDPGPGILGGLGPSQHHQLRGGNGGGQRPDPP